LRGGGSGSRHFAFYSGLLSNSWWAVPKLSGANPFQNFSNPLQNGEKTQHNREGNSNPWKQIEVVSKY
jgi:hypothetical protein